MERLYVLNRTDLPIAYRAVMGGHAVAEYMLNSNQVWKNEVLVYLDGGTEQDLLDWIEKFKRRDIEYYPFYEPDLGCQLASVAICGNKNLFRSLKIMGAE